MFFFHLSGSHFCLTSCYVIVAVNVLILYELTVVFNNEYISTIGYLYTGF